MVPCLIEGTLYQLAGSVIGLFYVFGLNIWYVQCAKTYYDRRDIKRRETKAKHNPYKGVVFMWTGYITSALVYYYYCTTCIIDDF